MRKQSLAAVALFAFLAGCSGGGSRSELPSIAQQTSGSAKTTLTIVIGGSAQSTARSSKTVPAANSKSIVIRYVGDGNPASAPTNPFGYPPTAPIASGTPVNLTTGPGGNCVPVGSSLSCTIAGVSLLVGVMDIYVLDYDNVNGTGNLIYASVTTVQVNANGTFTAPGTTTPTVFLNQLSGNTAATGAAITLTTGAFFGPNGAALASATPYPTSSPAIQVSGTDANNFALSGPIAPVTITDSDASGNTCLIYQKAGSNAATPCPFPSFGTQSKVVASNTGDKIYVQYDNAPMTVKGVTLSAPAPAPSSSPALVTTTVAFAPALFAGPSVAGPLSVFATGSTVYSTSGSGGAPNVAISKFTFSKGTFTPATGSAALPASAIVNIGGATSNGNLSFGVGAMTVGPDNNIWFVEPDLAGGPVPNYVGVYAVSQPVSNGVVPLGMVGQSLDLASVLGLNATALSGIASSGGYIWVLSTSGDVIRIDPSNVQNLGGTGVVGVAGNSTHGLTGFGAFEGLVAGGNGGFYFANGYSPTAGAIGGFAGNTSPSATSATLITSQGQTNVVGAPLAGIILGSDGNVWSSGFFNAQTTLAYANPNLSSVTTPTIVLPGGFIALPTFSGGVVQGGPDGMIWTQSFGGTPLAGLYGISTNASLQAAVFDTTAGQCSAIPTTPFGFGQQLATTGGYILSATGNGAICAAVP